MKTYSLFLRICVCAVSSLTLASCEIWDDEHRVDNNRIEFSVATATGADGEPLTRATKYGDSPVVMLGKGGRDTLYLHASIDVNTATVDEESMAETRGVPVKTDNFAAVCENFSVTAYTADEGKLFMSNELVKQSGNVWSPANGTRYWPEDALNFFAYAPYSVNDKQVFPNGISIKNQQKTIDFSYTVPTTTDKRDAEAQPDVMFATATCSRAETTGENGTVPLTFSHALAAVKFVANDIAGSTINSITLKGLHGSGTCIYSADAEDSKYKWSCTDDKNNTYTQTFDVKVEDQQQGEQPITDKNPSTTFMMLPQQLEGAMVEINLTTNDNKQHTLTGKLNTGNLTEWKAGYVYTYKISSESINWTYVFDVTPEIKLPLGKTSDVYKVKSYRYRTQDESVKEAVPWEVTGVTATDNQKPLDNPKSYVTEFKWGDGGMNDYQWKDYNIGVAKTVMHTTCNADTQLKEAASKGSPESPYDLSTEGGSMNMTTANCYVVNAAGTYKLPLVYGNAIVNGSTNSQAYSDSHFVDYNNEHINGPWISGTPKDATLVWSDGFYMFKDVDLSADKKYLIFTIDQDYIQQANAIVAVRDASGTIMWSWHIWVTERNINKTHKVDDWNNGATYDMMSSNLGWVDGKQVYYDPREFKFTFKQKKTGEEKTMTVTQVGETFDYKDAGSTYYQWGRKDPIVALMNRDKTGVDDYRRLDVPTDNYLYKTQPGWVTSADGIKHPNVYYVQNATSSSSTAWLTDAAYSPKLWNVDGTEGDKWVASSMKTVYDPSPKGFKVPMPRAFSVFVNGYDESGDVGGSLNGNVLPAPDDYQYEVYPKKDKVGTKIPFTATGQRSNRSDLGSGPGSLWAMYGVYYWTNAAQSNGTSYSFVIRREDEVNQDGSITPIASYTIGFKGTQTMARPVRPFKE